MPPGSATLQKDLLCLSIPNHRSLLTPVQLLRGYAKARRSLLRTSSALLPVFRISRTVQSKDVFPELNDIITTFFGDNYILTDQNLTRTLSIPKSLVVCHKEMTCLFLELIVYSWTSPRTGRHKRVLIGPDL